MTPLDTAMGMPATSDEELDALRGAVRSVLGSRSGEAAVRAAEESEHGFDRATWKLLSDQLGLQGLLAPPGQGGGGAGFRELAVVLEECGRALYPGPLLANALALDSLVQSGVEGELVEGLAAGAVLGAVALHQAGPSVQLKAGALEGTARFVLAGASADLFVVAVAEALYLVEPGASGITVEQLVLPDPTRRLAHVTFDATPARLISGKDGVRRLRSAACVGIAAEQVGGSEAALHGAIAYAKVRTQFGRTIGSFQSLKHHCAEVFLQIESGRAAVRRAAQALDEQNSEQELLASIAKAWCSDTYTHAVESSLQIHGGIGFTWEHLTHYHLKRAKTSELLFGDSRYHRHHLAELLGLRRSSS
jgi:alkylation response protein AidB-like acyl-CoA dehydrogenase